MITVNHHEKEIKTVTKLETYSLQLNKQELYDFVCALKHVSANSSKSYLNINSILSVINAERINFDDVRPRKVTGEIYHEHDKIFEKLDPVSFETNRVNVTYIYGEKDLCSINATHIIPDAYQYGCGAFWEYIKNIKMFYENLGFKISDTTLKETYYIINLSKFQAQTIKRLQQAIGGCPINSGRSTWDRIGKALEDAHIGGDLIEEKVGSLYFKENMND